MPNLNQSVPARTPVLPPLQFENPVSSALAKAAALHIDEKREEALAVLDAAISSGVAEPELYPAKALLQYELGQYKEASESYEQVLSASPQHPTAPYNLAVCYEKIGRWQEATAAFTKAVQREPNRIDARLGLGISLLHQEQAAPALECFEKVLSGNRSEERRVGK